MSGYGVLPYGTGYWGTGVSTVPTADATVFAAGDRKARIILASEPLHVSTTGTGDALNPRNWSLTEPATGKVWTILTVTMVDKFTYDLVTLEIFPNHFGQLQLATSSLVSPSGIPFPIIEKVFTGAYLDANSTNQKRTTARGYSPKDLANIPTPFEDLVGGTLQITSGGDYASMSGDALIRKLIMRRLVSKRGDFFHLPTYGAGLREKEPVPTVDLRKIATEVEQQVALEPEVAESRANVSYQAAASAMVIQVKARLKASGDVVQVALPVPTGTMQF